MAKITIENVPENFAKTMGKKIDFDKILWLYWDWMDWCQFDEVIPTKEDLNDSKRAQKSKEFLSEDEFFKKLK